MQRWALLLTAYTYDIQYRSSKAHANADGLSRLPLKSTELNMGVESRVYHVDGLPVQAPEIATETRKDPYLSKLLRYLKSGWPQQIPQGMEPFSRKRRELTTEGDCILWGVRIVLPSKLQARVQQEIHRGHPGVVKMKQLARSYVWWPDIDKHLEELAKSCEACQSHKNAPPCAPLHPWQWPQTPWERIHVDFLGPFLGKMIFVAIDAHSKWPEAQMMTTTTAAKTICVLREIFSRNGIPKQLVSDNGPQFCAEEFRQFMKNNGIEHIRTAPYHPASNGAAERLVQTLKQSLRASYQTGMPLDQALAIFLLKYRTTKHMTTGVAPCMLFCKRKLRTRLDLLVPDLRARVHKEQEKQKDYHDRHSQYRELSPGQLVWARNLSIG